MNSPGVPKDKTSWFSSKKLTCTDERIITPQFKPIRENFAISINQSILVFLGVRSRDDLETSDLFGDWVKRNHALNAVFAFLEHALITVEVLNIRIPIFIITFRVLPRSPADERVHAC